MRRSPLDSLPAFYRRALAAYQPMGRDEEVALIARAQRGDAQAADRVARQHLALVITLCCAFKRGDISIDDVIQEGNRGLLRALAKFDPSVGTRFSTYAAWWVKAYVRKHLQEARSVVRPKCHDTAIQDVALDAPAGVRDETVGDSLADDALSPEDASVRASAKRVVWGWVERSRAARDEVNRDILRDRLVANDPVTLQVIGDRHGMSREAVRQREAHIKRAMRRELAEVA